MSKRPPAKHVQPSKKPQKLSHVCSYEALGRIVGCHPKSFRNFRRHHADAPAPTSNGKHSVHAWREFFEAHPQIRLKSQSVLCERQSGLQMEKLREQCRRLTFENDEIESRYLLKSDVEQWLSKMIEGQEYILSNKLKNELPPKIEGLRAPEIAAQMEPVIHEICSLLRTLPQVPIPARSGRRDVSKK